MMSEEEPQQPSADQPAASTPDSPPSQPPTPTASASASPPPAYSGPYVPPPPAPGTQQHYKWTNGQTDAPTNKPIIVRHFVDGREVHEALHRKYIMSLISGVLLLVLSITMAFAVRLNPWTFYWHPFLNLFWILSLLLSGFIFYRAFQFKSMSEEAQRTGLLIGPPEYGTIDYNSEPIL